MKGSNLKPVRQCTPSSILSIIIVCRLIGRGTSQKWRRSRASTPADAAMRAARGARWLVAGRAADRPASITWGPCAARSPGWQRPTRLYAAHVGHRAGGVAPWRGEVRRRCHAPSPAQPSPAQPSPAQPSLTVGPPSSEFGWCWR